MTRVKVKLEIEVTAFVHNIDIQTFINELEYTLEDTTGEAQLINTEIVHSEIIDEDDGD